MSVFKTKRRTSDKYWTKYIKLRDKDICFWCGNLCDNPRNSGVSHYKGRRKENTRFDDDNSDLMHNIPCHLEAEQEKKIKGIKDAKEDGKYTKRKKKQLGDKRFNQLLINSQIYKKRDDKCDTIIIRSMIDELKKVFNN